MRFVTLFFLFAITIDVESQSNLKTEIEKIVKYDTEISFDLTPGFIVGVIDNDSTYIIPFGKSLDANFNELSSNDVFEIGSITKLFTISLFYILEEEGIIKLNEKVNDFFENEYKNPRLKELTVKDLINQNTDFPKRPSMFGEFEDDPQNPYSNYSKENLLKFYKDFVPNHQPGFNYSHVNFALLELIAERVSNTEFEVLMIEKLFKPLKMEHSFIHYKEKKINVITPGVDLSLNRVRPWTFNSFAGSEGIKSSISDMLNFTKSYFSKKNSTLLKIHSKNLDERIPSFNEDLYYSSGWYSINVNRKTRVLASSGRTNGHSSFIGMVPENNTSVVVLSNSSYGTFDLGMLILRMINDNWKRKPQQ